MQIPILRDRHQSSGAKRPLASTTLAHRTYSPAKSVPFVSIICLAERRWLWHAEVIQVHQYNRGHNDHDDFEGGRIGRGFTGSFASIRR